ncbi:DNA translocase FtsK 4TM domain-containing protein, partial [Cupriavidus basilensis]|uniref:DNA translocase FtsK 4TM domain-containing protein n=1 Tax=Cupriavidus basilensis TaxID=68895 RepID=UPI003D333490
MGFGWFGFSTLWLVPLVWRLVTRLLAGERRFLSGRGTLRVWVGTLIVLCASASLEALTGAAGEAGMAGSTSGGSAGRALGGLVSGMLGWSASLLVMLGVLALAAPMIFGETWRSLFLREPRPAEPEEADLAPARSAVRTPVRTVREPDNWETTHLGTTHGAVPGTSDHVPRHKGIEAVSARRQPVWQPPARTRESPPQPGEIWLQQAAPPEAAAPAPQPAVSRAPAKPAPARATGQNRSASQATARTASAAAAATTSIAAAAQPRTAAMATAAQARSSGTATAATPRASAASNPVRQPQPVVRSAITTLPEAGSRTARPDAGRNPATAPAAVAAAAPASVQAKAGGAAIPVGNAAPQDGEQGQDNTADHLPGEPAAARQAPPAMAEAVAGQAHTPPAPIEPVAVLEEKTAPAQPLAE